MSDLWFFEALKGSGIFFIKTVLFICTNCICKQNTFRYWLKLLSNPAASVIKYYAFSLKRVVFRRILSVVLVMCHFLKLQSMLLSKFQSFLVTAVTIQTSGASRDFALYSLEVLRGRQIYHLYFITPINALVFIRTCAKVLP